MKKKGRKTTIVAILSGLIGLLVFLMWIFGEIQTLELAVVLSAVGLLSNVLNGYFSKDATASHSLDIIASSGGHADPTKEEK